MRCAHMLGDDKIEPLTKCLLSAESEERNASLVPSTDLPRPISVYDSVGDAS
jgi:hypothetical protein